MKTTILFCAAEIISQSKWIWFHRQPQWLSDVGLYDQASRGPSGALSMLWHIRWRDLSSLASLFVLCSMLIDPFAQQLTHLQLERIAVDFNASLPVQSLLNGKGSLFGTKVAAKAAFDGSKVPDTIANCPTGNCSWNPYQSLAVCYQCVNISDLIQIKDFCFYENTQTCAAYLKNGLAIDFGSRFNTSANIVMNTTSTSALLRIGDVGQSLINFTKVFHDAASSINQKGCYYREPSYIAQCVQDIKDTTTATECSLYWCVNHYAATYESRSLNETVMSSWWSGSSFDIVALGEFGLDRGDVEEYTSPHFQLLPSLDNSNVNIHAQNFSREYTGEVHPRTSGQRPGYAPCYVATNTDADLGLWLSDLFTKELDYASFLESAANNTNDPAFILAGRNQLPYGSPVDERGIRRPDPVFNIFADVASALTHSIRTETYTHNSSFYRFNSYPLKRNLPGGNYTKLFLGNKSRIDYYFNFDISHAHDLDFIAYGNDIVDRTIVRVRWGWLFIPASLIKVTGALTIATKIRGSRQHIPQWGSSTTALMINGPYSYINEPSSSTPSARRQRLAEMKSAKVMLKRGKDGSWRLAIRDGNVIGGRSTARMPATQLLPRSTPSKTRDSGSRKRGFGGPDIGS